MHVLRNNIFMLYIFPQETGTRIFILSMYDYHARSILCEVRNNKIKLYILIFNSIMKIHYILILMLLESLN